MNFLKTRILIFFFIISLIFFTHIYKITKIPAGLYVDEVSIGYNAALISKTGHDEFNKLLPLFTQSFGDYKSPFYIYSAAVLFLLVGVSELTLRLTSFIFYSIFLFFGYLTIKEKFSSHNKVIYYFLLSAGFIPWLFTVSRVAFEVISSVALLSIVLFLVNKLFQSKKHSLLLLCTIGVTSGFEFYTYPTSRLHTIFFVSTIVVIYFKKETIYKIFGLIGGFILMLIPAIVLYFTNYHSLTARFLAISYIDDSLSVSTKLLIFITNYLWHFSPQFLLLYGDNNLRHSIGQGQVQIAVYIFFVCGILYLITSKKYFYDKFFMFLCVNLVLSPIASTLTYESPHALRSITLCIYILFISCYGFVYICKQKYHIVAYILVFFLVLQNSFFLFKYFTEYKNISIQAFNNYNYQQSLSDIYSQKPTKIYSYGIHPVYELFYKQIKPYSNLPKFEYINKINNLQKINLNKSCILYPEKDMDKLKTIIKKNCTYLKKSSLIVIQCCR